MVENTWWKDTAKLPCDLHLLEEKFWGAAEWSTVFYFLCYQVRSLTQYLLPTTEISIDFSIKAILSFQSRDADSSGEQAPLQCQKCH